MSGVAIATIVSTVIASIVGWLTQRSASHATEVVADTTTRGDIEKEAFSRAETFYKNALDRQDLNISRQDQEIAAQQVEIAALKEEVVKSNKSQSACVQRISALEAEVAYYRRSGSRLARWVYEARKELASGKSMDDDLDDDLIPFIDENPA